MKIAGHTIGMPEYSLPQAMRVFAQMGFDGVESLVQGDGYPCAIDFHADAGVLCELRALVDGLGLPFACVSTYQRDFDSADAAKRQAAADGLLRLIDTAQYLGAGLVRVFAGRGCEGALWPEAAARYAGALRPCAAHAQQARVRLVIELHDGSLADTAENARRLLEGVAQEGAAQEGVAHPAVGVLYDQANLFALGAEEYPEAIERLGAYIWHVHVKDMAYREGGGLPARNCMPGEGALDWRAILPALRAAGYAGEWLSLEYERRWSPADLPPAAEGLPGALRYFREILAEMDWR